MGSVVSSWAFPVLAVVNKQAWGLVICGHFVFSSLLFCRYQVLRPARRLSAAFHGFSPSLYKQPVVVVVCCTKATV